MNKSVIISRVCVFVCLFLGTTAGRTQLSGFEVVRYGVNQGVADAYVMDIHQDSIGFLWVTTANGLSRFDGRSFENYGVAEGISNLYVNSVMEDRNHRLWITTWKHIMQLKGERFIPYKLGDTSDINYIYRIRQLADGHLWAFTNQGSFEFDNVHWVSKPIADEKRGRKCLDILQIKGGAYINFGDEISWKPDDQPMQSVWKWTQPGFIYFNQMVLHRNVLYTTTRDGIFRLERNGSFTRIFENIITKGWFPSILLDSRNQCWISMGGSSKIYLGNPEGRGQLLDSVDLKVPLISALYEDRQGQIWVGSGEGLVKLIPKSYTVFSGKTHPLINGIGNIVCTPARQLLAFSGANGIITFKHGTFVKANFLHDKKDHINLKNDFADGFALDDNQRLWITTRNDNLFFLEGTKLYSQKHLLLGRRDLVGIAFNKVTKTLMLCQDTLKFLSNNVLKPFKSANTASLVLYPSAITCFRNGNMLVSSRVQGVQMIAPDGNMTDVNHALTIQSGAEGQLFYEEDEKHFWLYHTGDGMKRYQWDENKLPVVDFVIREGLPDQKVTGMCIDRQGKIWVSTSRGGTVILPNYKNGTYKVAYLATELSETSEMPANGRWSLDSSGAVWYSNREHITRFETEKVVFDTTKPNVAIEQVRLSQPDISWENFTKEFTGYWRLPLNPVLPHNENTFQIHFSGIALGPAKGLQYAYRLSGLDSLWSTPFTGNFVVLAKLPPGDFDFQVRARTNNSQWSDAASFSFTIDAPFWNRWWFRLIVLGLAAAVILRIYQKTVERIEQKAQLKQQLNDLEMTALKAQMNPHFIYNALNSIQALVADERADEAIHYIGSFSRLLRQVLVQSERHVISLEKELQTLELYIDLELLRMNARPLYTLTMAPGINAAHEVIPPLLLQPFVENALWHGLSRLAGTKKLLLHIDASQDFLIITIEDNGIGRAEAGKHSHSTHTDHHSMAMGITTRRLADFNGEENSSPVTITDLCTDDGRAKGTRVQLKVRRINPAAILA